MLPNLGHLSKARAPGQLQVTSEFDPVPHGSRNISRFIKDLMQVSKHFLQQARRSNSKFGGLYA